MSYDGSLMKISIKLYINNCGTITIITQTRHCDIVSCSYIVYCTLYRLASIKRDYAWFGDSEDTVVPILYNCCNFICCERVNGVYKLRITCSTSIVASLAA